jgi:hypothetical protein
MFQLDEKFLQSVGLTSLSEDQKKPFLEHIFKELQIRVGVRLSDGLTDEQLGEFEELHKSSPQDALRWLEANRPSYREIVAAELAKLQQEIINGKDKILERTAA